MSDTDEAARRGLSRPHAFKKRSVIVIIVVVVMVLLVLLMFFVMAVMWIAIVEIVSMFPGGAGVYRAAGTCCEQCYYSHAYNCYRVMQRIEETFLKTVIWILLLR